MKLEWDTYLGRNHAVICARKVLKACGQTKPPICHMTVTDYLGLKLSDRLPDGFPTMPHIENPELHETLSTCCERLDREKMELWFYKHMSRQRIRSAIFHGDGHFINPWHVGIDIFTCSESAITGLTYSRQEREAWSGGAEFHMPSDTFVKDTLDSGPINISAIRALAKIYDASLEATAIRYGQTHPHLCAVVMIEPSPTHHQRDRDNVANGQGDNGQSCFPWQIPQRSKTIEHHPLRVRYASRSRRFPKFIRPGVGIDQNNLIFEAWSKGKPLVGEIPASAFGSSEKWAYHAECLPYRKGGKILTLLWLTDRQLSLKIFV